MHYVVSIMHILIMLIAFNILHTESDAFPLRHYHAYAEETNDEKREQNA